MTTLFARTSLVLTALVVGAGAGSLHSQNQMTDECVIPDVTVFPSFAAKREPADLALARAQQAMLLGPDGKRFALVEMPGCRLRDIKLSGEVLRFASSYTVPGGRTLYQTESWNVEGPEGPSRSIEPPAHMLSGRLPILANDGRSVAWIVSDPSVPPKFIYGRGTYYVPRLVVQSIESGQTSFVPLPAGTLAKESYSPLPRLLAFDVEKKEITLAVEDVETESPRYLAVGLDGARSWGPITTEGVPKGPAESANFRRLGDGWVAWGDDLNIRNDPMRIVWSLKSGRGSHRVKTPMAPFQHPKIDSAAVSPDGEFIAVSVALRTRMLLSKGRTYVFRVRDGKVVFDHTMSGENGSGVAFLGNDHFVYSDYDRQKPRHETHVVKLPK